MDRQRGWVPYNKKKTEVSQAMASMVRFHVLR
jgi:hypothetical protein